MIYPWQQATWNTIQQSRQAGRLPHALLLSGETGCGNEAFVEALMHSLLCLEPDAQGMACGQCRSCQVYQAHAHPDQLSIKKEDGKQIISVDQVRELGRFLSLSLSYSPVRVVSLLGAETMNVNAANSLLKSLEEPNNNTHLLLLSYQNSKLLPTIRSRCQQLRLPVPSREQALAWLSQHTLSSDANTLLDLALGRPLAALALDSSELSEQQQQFFADLITVLQGKMLLTQFAQTWQKHDRNSMIDWQLQALQNSLQQHYQLNISTTANSQQARLLKGLSRWSSQRLWQIHDQLLQLKQLSTHPLNAQIFVETMLTYWLDKKSS